MCLAATVALMTSITVLRPHAQQRHGIQDGAVKVLFEEAVDGGKALSGMRGPACIPVFRAKSDEETVNLPETLVVDMRQSSHMKAHVAPMGLREHLQAHKPSPWHVCTCSRMLPLLSDQVLSRNAVGSREQNTQEDRREHRKWDKRSYTSSRARRAQSISRGLSPRNR